MISEPCSLWIDVRNDWDLQQRNITRLGDNCCAIVSAANKSSTNRSLLFNMVKQMMINHFYVFMLERQSNANCSAILSEDMQDGRRLNGVAFINPFSSGAEARLAALLEA